MSKTAGMTRRLFFCASGSAAVVGLGLSNAGKTRAATDLSSENEGVVRRYYKLWETPDWGPMDHLLANTFTFTSAAGDDHISKADFKTQCWDTQVGNTKGFDLLQLAGSGGAVFVKYVGHTKNSRSFQNVEFLQVRGGHVMSIECYFGQKNSFPTAVSAEKT